MELTDFATLDEFGQDDPSTYAIPTVDDPRWQMWCAPLRAYLRTAHTWPEIFLWAESHGRRRVFVRQMVAALSFRRLVGWRDDRKAWRAMH